MMLLLLVHNSECLGQIEDVSWRRRKVSSGIISALKYLHWNHACILLNVHLVVLFTLDEKKILDPVSH